MTRLASAPQGNAGQLVLAPAENNRAVGLAMAIGTTIVAALQPIILRYGALNSDPLTFATVAVGAAAIVAAIVLTCSGEIKVLLRREYAPRLFVVSMTGTLATALLLIYGLRRIDAIAGVLLLETEPIYSLILSTLFLGERPSGRQLFATAIVLFGIGSAFGANHAFSPLYAAALVLVTPLFWQISHVLALRLMPPIRPLGLAGARYIYSALVLSAILIVVHRGAITQLAGRDVLLAGGFTGAVVYFIGSLTWYGAISRLSLAWTTAFVIPGVPLLSIGFAILFLGERPGVREVAGIVVAIVGVVFLITGGDTSRVPAIEAAEATHQPLA